jgi:hypothetical protein
VSPRYPLSRDREGSIKVPDRLAAAAWWLAPVLFLFLLYFKGLTTWFFGDDFAWLGLLRRVHGFHDFLSLMFRPAAQGTIRFLGERGFFLLFEKLFGMESLPFRIWVFLTMAANVLLVAWITVRVTGSRLAGALAPILWTANTGLALVMTWTSAWNEALCSLFLLSATALFMRYAETGRRAFWWWQLVVFTLGFGALEINIVYPAIAAAYALFVAPPPRRAKLLTSVIPLAGISVGYFILHRAVAPFMTEGPYVVAVDRRIVPTFLTYLRWSMLPQNWVAFGHSAIGGWVIFAVAGLGLAAFCIRQIVHKRYAVIFFLCWFLLGIAPVLSLPDHISDYYLTVPLIGLAMAGAWGIAMAWRSTPLLRVAALIPLVAYLGAMLPSTRTAVNYWVERGYPIRGLVLGVQAAQQAHPGKAIVLDGITSQLYDDAVGASAFFPLGLDNIYLTPESRDSIHPLDNPEKLDDLVLEPGVMRSAITHDQVVVYSSVRDHLRNSTWDYERSALDRLANSEPRRVEVGNPLFGYLLGPEWYPLESDFRWMPKHATLRMGGPDSDKDRLLLQGFCPDVQLRSGPLHLFVTVDRVPLEGIQIAEPENSFRRLLVIPRSLIGRKTVQVEITVNRTTHAPDGRELGVVFGTISIQP